MCFYGNYENVQSAPNTQKYNKCLYKFYFFSCPRKNMKLHENPRSVYTFPISSNLWNLAGFSDFFRRIPSKVSCNEYEIASSGKRVSRDFDLDGYFRSNVRNMLSFNYTGPAERSTNRRRIRKLPEQLKNHSPRGR